VTGTVIGSLTIAPIVATLVVGIGVPILLFYVYGVVPISLCRSGGCGVSKNNNGGVRFAFDEEEYENTTNSLNNNNSNTANINNANNQTSKEKKTVTIPISAIEPKVADSILVSSDTVPDVTPVLVTITMANNKENNNNTSIQNTNKKTSKKSSKRNKSKKESIKFQKIAIETNSLCGSVEMSSQIKLKSNKSKRKSNEHEISKSNTVVNSSCGSKLKEEKTIAGEAGIAAVSALRKLNHINDNLNMDDLRKNFLSTTTSSSSQNLLNDEQKSNDESTSIRNSYTTNTNKNNINSNNKNLKEFLNKIVNPSIGEASIGAFTITSANSGAENNYYEYDEYCEDPDAIMYEDTCTNENDFDHKSSSNKPVTSGSNYKLSDSISINTTTTTNTTATNNGNQTNENKHHTSSQRSKTQHDLKRVHLEPKALTFYPSDFDNYSVSIFSEKSANPSMTAFAGSIKDSFSADNLTDKI